MTVAELIARLQQLPPGATVLSEVQFLDGDERRTERVEVSDVQVGWRNIPAGEHDAVFVVGVMEERP